MRASTGQHNIPACGRRFQLGAGRVIGGYERGVPGMCRGEVRTLLVPPGLAYGERGVPGTIPPGRAHYLTSIICHLYIYYVSTNISTDATLHFTVELLSIADGQLPPPPPPPRVEVGHIRGSRYLDI